MVVTSRNLLVIGESAPIRERESAATHIIDTALKLAFCTVLALAPLAFGSVEAWAMCALEVASGALFTLWCLRELFAQRAILQLNPLLIPMLLMAALVTMQLIFSATSYWYASWYRALLLICYALMFFVTTQVLTTRSALRDFGFFLSAYGFLVAFVAEAQEITLGGKIFWIYPTEEGGFFYGPYVDHAHYAGLMEMLWPIPLVLGLTAQFRSAIRIGLLFCAILMASSIFLSRSFGGIIAFFAQVIVLAALVLRQRNRGSGFVWLLGALFALSLLLVALQPTGLINRALDIIGTASSDPVSRWAIIRDSIRMARERPLVGWGVGTFPEVFPAFKTFYTDKVINAAHNEYVQVLVEMGLLGLGIMFWFIVALCRRGYRNVRDWTHDVGSAMSLAALLGCLGLLVHSLSDFNLQIPANGALFFVLAAIASRVRPPITERQSG